MMVAALVIVGVAACSKTDETIEQLADREGVSFYATFDDDLTRAYIDDSDGDKLWKTIWEDGDVLDVTTDDTKFYTFIYNASTGKFICTDEGIDDIIGKTIYVTSLDGGNRDSKSGKRAWDVRRATVENFTSGTTVKLEAITSFFRYTYNGEEDITFEVKVSAESVAPNSVPYVFQYNHGFFETVTISGVKGENFIGFWTQNAQPVEANLSYSIAGEKIKQTTLNLAPGKVYNLGNLTPAEQDLAKIYLVPNSDWMQADAWFVAHFFNSTDGFADVKLTDDNADGIYECSVPAGMENVLFCRMNPAYSEFGWNDETVTDRVWNQTGDEVIGVEPDNYYYITDWTSGIWGDSEGYDVPVLSLGVIGLGGNWDTDKDMTLEGDYYTLKNVAIAATDTFKIRAYDAWAENYGIASSATADSVAIEIDTMYSLVQDGKNMQVAAGTYDLYFNYTTKEFYAMTVGTTPDDIAIPQYKIYLHTMNNTWAKYNLYSWDANGNNPTGAWAGTTATATETINGYDYYVWTMPRSATGASLNIIINDGTSQTDDFALGTLDKDYYLLLNGMLLSIVEDKENPEPEIVEGEPQPSTWALAGEFNNWGDQVMYTTSEPNLFVAEGIEIGAYKKIKVKQVSSWNTSYGANSVNYLNANIWTKVKSNGSDLYIINEGTYDIYFDYANTRIYVMKTGEDYTTATEQATSGAAPDLSGASWGLCGAHNNWGTSDTALVWDSTIGLYVAKNAKITGEFKVRTNNAWTTNYGGKTVTVDDAAGTVLTANSSGNCKLSKTGTYDIYWDYSTKKIWARTPGSAAPTK